MAKATVPYNRLVSPSRLRPPAPPKIARINFILGGNIPLARITDNPAFVQKGQRSRCEFSNHKKSVGEMAFFSTWLYRKFAFGFSKVCKGLWLLLRLYNDIMR